MSVILTIAGSTFNYPTEGEDDAWGEEATNWAIAVSTDLLQRTGGTFSLTNDVNFGASFATIQAYLKSRTANISTAGFIRMANADSVAWRNAANNGNLLLGVDSSNNLTFNGTIIIPGTIGANNFALVSNGTSPTWALLLDANISGSAAIARTKLASGTNYRILANNSSGVMSENAALTSGHVVIVDSNGQLAGEGQLSVSRGGTGQTTVTAAFNALSPLTTKGDLLTWHTASNQRLPVGTNGQVLTADSGETAGFKWATIAGSSSYQINNLGVSVANNGGNDLVITTTTSSGSTPSAGDAVTVGFGSATAANGTYSTPSITGATTFTIPSGATLGQASGRDQLIFWYKVNNAGTIVDGVSSAVFDEGKTHNTTAIGTGSDSNSVLYTAAGLSGVRVRLVGAFMNNQAVAGVYASNVSRIMLVPFEIPKVAAKYRTNAGQSISGTPSVVDYEDLVYDNYNCVTVGASWKFVCLKANKYRVHQQGVFDSAAFTAGNYQSGTVLVNTVTAEVLSRNPVQASLTTYFEVKGSTELDLAVGDEVQFTLEQSSGGARTLFANAEYNYVTISEI